MRASCSRSTQHARAAVRGGLSCALALVALSGCSGGRATRPAPQAPSPVERPESVIVEGSASDFAALRGALPRALGETLPENAAGLVEATCARTPASLRDRVAADARGVFVLLRGAPGADSGFALGVRVRIDEGAAPLGAGTTVGALGAEGAPADARWVGGTPLANHTALALIGDVLVCAQSASDLSTAGTYVARTLVPAAEGDARVAALRAPPTVVGAPIVAHAVAGAVARDVRRWLEATLTDVTSDLSASARHAVAAHSAPPVLGDPVALVAIVRSRLGTLGAMLPDVGGVHGTLAPGGGGLVLSMRADVAAGSPLDAALDALPTVEARSLGALPRGTALAALFPAEPATARSSWSFGDGLAEDLTRIAGPRLSADDAIKLRDALSNLGAARGASLVAALGRGLSGPFALLASAHASAPPAAERLSAALGTGYVRGSMGLALGCTGDAAPRAMSAPIALGNTSLRVLDVCGAHAPVAGASATARSPRFDLATQGDAWAMSVTQLPSGPSGGPLSSVAARVASALSGVEDGAPLAADPDTARALAALPERAHFALAVLPELLVGSASLLPIDALARAASTADEPPPGPPLLLTLGRDGDALTLVLVLPTPALAHTAETVAAASSLSP